MEVGTIKAVHIYLHEQLYVTAELELNVKGINYSFGGDQVFLSGKNGGDPCDPPLLGRFLFRCMQICDVDNWDLLRSRKVLIKLCTGRVIAIGNIVSEKWFNPAEEFQKMSSQKRATTSDLN